MISTESREAPSSGDPTVACVADFVGRILAATRASTAEALASTDLTFSQVRTLFVLLQDEDGLPTNEVAEQVGLSLAATGRAADRLVSLGLVDRREDHRDRRVKLLSLTLAGTDLLAHHLRLREADVCAVLDPVPVDVRARLHAALSEAVSYLPVAGACGLPIQND